MIFITTRRFGKCFCFRLRGKLKLGSPPYLNDPLQYTQYHSLSKDETTFRNASISAERKLYKRAYVQGLTTKNLFSTLSISLMMIMTIMIVIIVADECQSVEFAVKTRITARTYIFSVHSAIFMAVNR
jgi:hypothetical protein